MAKSLWIGIFMSILVFAILIYTCYQYIFNIQESLNEQRLKWYWNWNSDIALILCIMSLISYCKIMLEPEIQLPLNQLTENTEDKVLQFPKLYHTVDGNQSVKFLSICEEKGQPLFCRKCKSNKPERTHHCRECNRCTAKMDHHCIWINGCVNDENYKYFFLFVLYVATYSIWVEANSVPLLLARVKEEIGSITLAFMWKLYKAYLQSVYYVWRNIFLIILHRKWIPLSTDVPGLGLQNISPHWYAVSFLGFLFGLALFGFSIVHFYYIVRNQTSIENVSKRPVYVRVDFDQSGENYEVVVTSNSNVYDLGLFSNWCSVMGNQPLLWFVPYKPRDDQIFDKMYKLNPAFEARVIDLAIKQREERMKDYSQN